ncbi:MAG TPA: hypothetical protein VLS25_12930, partial [Dehalococcoidia bacterium]|nr:hypothetical protein [Dehalococcoidia bacterium]
DQVPFTPGPPPNDVDPGDVCPPMPTPAGAMNPSQCLIDTRDAPPFDTVTSLGIFMMVDDGKGLEAESTLAAMKFHGEGSVGECTNLKITVESFIDPNGHNLSPAITAGKICIAEGTQRAWADVDCGGTVGIEDAQRIAKKLANKTAATPAGCYDIGSEVTVNGTPRSWADVDCGSTVGIEDAQRIAKKLANKAAATPAGCYDIGASVTVN